MVASFVEQWNTVGVSQSLVWTGGWSNAAIGLWRCHAVRWNQSAIFGIYQVWSALELRCDVIKLFGNFWMWDHVLEEVQDPAVMSIFADAVDEVCLCLDKAAILLHQYLVAGCEVGKSRHKEGLGRPRRGQLSWSQGCSV